jgi:hypothetical protein
MAQTEGSPDELAAFGRGGVRCRRVVAIVNSKDDIDRYLKMRRM